jgi:calcium-dependent protein kinase
MTQEEKLPLIEAFRTFDVDGDAKLSKEELATAMRQILTEDRAEGAAARVMQTLDLDNNGFLDFSEFIIAASDLSALLSARSLKVAFDLFDEDKSGSISIEEFRSVLKVREHPEVLDELIGRVDKNKDGELGLEEFTRMIKLAVGEAVGAKGL